jgi:DNA-binding winged helix-turn-helix (wHTH) protein/tetratricopeptide (TPR) repeat protein
MREHGLTFGRYRLDPRGGLTLGGREVRLTPKALAVLCFLAARPGRLVTKEELFESVWSGTVVGDAALVSCIQELRRALRDDARRPRFIETLHRRGYRFIATPAQDAGIAPRQAAPLLVGREPELARLHDALERARGGERQTVFVSGEAGIGKTSLVRTFVSRAEAMSGVEIVWGQSVEHYGASEPYLPVLEALMRACRGPSGERFVATLKLYAPTWLAQMPSLLAPPQRRDLGRRTGGVTRERMLRELTGALEAAAEGACIVLWLEDLHWSDVSTIDWLAAFACRPERARVLLVGTYRPAEALAPGHPLRAMQDTLRRQGRAVEIALPSLTRAAVSEYVVRRFAPGPTPTDPLSGLAAEVHARTEGTPLFMVGVLDDLVAAGVLAHVDGRWAVRGAARAGALGIPDDLQRLIARQLDRLDPTEARALEVASLVGAQFSAAAVAAGAGVAQDDVETMCQELARRQQLIHAAGAEEWPDGTVASRFGFHHALYREALSERLPAGRRVELHLRIGDRLEQAWGDRAAEIAGELAMHFERGRATERAIGYLSSAGKSAGHRGAAHEAAAYFARALDLLATLPASRARDEREAQVRLAACVPLIALHGYGSSVVETSAARAKTLWDTLDDPRGLFAANRVVWNGSVMRHPVPRTLVHARELMRLAERAREPALLALAHRALGTTLQLAGKLEEAAGLLERGFALADGVPDDAFIDYGEHPGMICRVFAGWARSLMGSLDTGARLADEAIEHARARTVPHSLAFALVSSGMLFVFQRAVDRAEPIGTEVIALAREYRLPQWLGFGQEIKGWAMARRGDAADGIRLQEAGLSDLLATGARTHLGRMYANLVESYLDAGEPESAGKHLAAAHEHRERHGEHYYAPELLRLQARRLAIDGVSPKEVERCLVDALTVARAQGSGLLGLRAAVDLARLRAARGDERGARDVLSSWYGALREGFGWPDAVAARTFLDELSVTL